jgi:leucyl-tRNA synthetase
MILSHSHRDKRGVYHSYDEIEHTEDGKAMLRDSEEILTSQVEKMSKSKKNVINPDDVIKQHGADVFRLYEMFMGPFADSKPWDMKDIMGRVRFLRRVWALLGDPGNIGEGEGLTSMRHKTIQKVGTDIAALRFNTAISALDIYLNDLYAQKPIARTDAETFLTLLNPFAPHITEELWEKLGNKPFLSSRAWPPFDPEQLVDDQAVIVVQVNGKVRDRMEIATGSTREQTQEKALTLSKVCDIVKDKKVVKVIVIPDKLVNIVVA